MTTSTYKLKPFRYIRISRTGEESVLSNDIDNHSIDYITRHLGEVIPVFTSECLTKQICIDTEHPSQEKLMSYDPASGQIHPYPSHAKQFREYHGKTAWLFNPWTGNIRNANDVGSDTFGHLIEPGAEEPEPAEKAEKPEPAEKAEKPDIFNRIFNGIDMTSALGKW